MSVERKQEQYQYFKNQAFTDINSQYYIEEKYRNRGKILILEHNKSNSSVNFDNLVVSYLQGDGDYRSREVLELRDEADMIITNPPFSKIEDFLNWLTEADKRFLFVGTLNMAGYTKIFPRFKNNSLWFGATCNNSDMVFEVPKGYPVKEADRRKAQRLGFDGNFTRQGNACWLTNLEHGIRHEPLKLMTLKENLKYSSHRKIREQGYLPYFNYDGIDVPYVDAIPSDYDGVMGVPLSFLTKFNPDQFNLVDKGGTAPKLYTHITRKAENKCYYLDHDKVIWEGPLVGVDLKCGNALRISDNGKPGPVPFERILIRRK